MTILRTDTERDEIWLNPEEMILFISFGGGASAIRTCMNADAAENAGLRR